MHARLKPGHKAMLAIAAIVLAGGGAAIVISTLNSGPPASEAAGSSLRTYHAGQWDLSFHYPASWSPRHYGTVSSFSIPIVYLSNQPLHHPCTRRRLDPKGSAISCGAPLDRLRPGGVLVEWTENGFPGWSFRQARGTPMKVDGLRARLLTTDNRCGSLRADRRMVLTVERPDASDNFYELLACFRGSDSASTEAQIRDLIGSTTFADAKSPGKHASATAPGPIARKGAFAGRLIVKPASVTPGERIGVAVRNLGDKTLSYGLELHVERRSGGTWRSARESVYGAGPVAFPLVLFSVPPSDAAGPHHNGGTFDGVTLPRKLEPGRYRFLKPVWGASRPGDHPDMELTAGFRVRRPDVLPDQGLASRIIAPHNGLDKTTLAAAQRDAQFTLLVPDDPAANLENMTGVFDDRSGTTLTLEFPPPDETSNDLVQPYISISGDANCGW